MTADEPREPQGAADERPPRNPSARVLVFETLYEHDLARHPAGEVLKRLAEEQWADSELAAAAEALVGGVLADRPILDETIGHLAPAWPLVQMSAIDRNILRLGLYEVRRAETPAQEREAISGAVELAKRYGSDSSPRFVRGVLGRAAAPRSPAQSSDSEPPG